MARKILVAHGPDWTLEWPSILWHQLTPDEQRAVITRQSALMRQGGEKAQTKSGERFRQNRT